MRTPSLIEMVNEIVQEGGDKISKDASKAEERLNLKLRRWVHNTGRRSYIIVFSYINFIEY